MKLTYYGVRGSVPRPLTGYEIYDRIASNVKGDSVSLKQLKSLAGKGLLSYGGNTSCVLLSQDDFDLIIDAGSGLRVASSHFLTKNSGPVHILLTHLHWDHIQGIPFFVPLFMQGREIHFHSCIPAKTVKKALEQQGMEPYFPVPFGDLLSKTHFHEYNDKKQFKIGPFKVKSLELEHPQDTYAYKVSHGENSYVHMSDTEITFLKAAEKKKYANFLKDTSFVSFDSQFSSEEAHKFATWGHSCADHFIDNFSNIGVKTLALFHHNPQLGEENVDKLFAQAKKHLKKVNPKSGMKVIAAIEGQTHKIS